MNADVEEAPDDGTEHKHNRGPKVEGNDIPVMRIEDGVKHGDVSSVQVRRNVR